MMKSHKGKARKGGGRLHSVNARKEGGRAPIRNTVAGKEGKLKLHAQPTTRALSQHIFPIKPPPPFSELTLSCMHAFASPPRHQPPNPRLF